ncbi:MAG: peptidylprolyl isomerase [Anaerolineaceae bacterium]|nr:peptidylprolyl isomerase [Anaerolineaceae bacterium]
MNDTKISIGKNKIVKLQYALFVDNNRLGNCDPDPVTYLHGYNQIIPGFEKNVEGLLEGATKTFEVSPEEAYGFREEDATISMPLSEFPSEIPLEIGAELQMVNEDGDELPGWLTEISDDQITIDFNHPLADKSLRFDVEILSIREATQKEIRDEEANE